MIPRRVSRLLHDDAWVRALMDVDVRGDKTKLIELLKSKTAITYEARWHIADLLDRYQLRGQRGGKRKKGEKGGGRTPSYRKTDSVAQLDAASNFVRRAVKDGTSLADAVTRAVAHYGVNEETLHSDLEGKHANARRQRKRRPPAS